MSVTCENNHLSAEQQIQTLLRTDGTLNGLALEVVTTPEDIEPALNCDKNSLTFIDLFLLSIGVDSCGKPSIRAINILSCDQVKNCDNNAYDFLNSIFAYSPALNQYYIVLVLPV
jgi:hypothetical protein